LDYLSCFDIVCYILIVGLNYVKSDYLLLTNSNPSGLLGQKDFKNDVLNDMTCSGVTVVAITDAK
jgi:hypothetical protein